MERFFLFSLFFYLLSALLAVGSNRSESRLSLPVSKLSYLFGTLIVFVILLFRLKSHGNMVITNFFEGMLFALCVLGVVYVLTQIKISIPHAPAVLSLLSMVLGILALLRISEEPNLTAMHSLILGGHVACMFLALAAFTLSFVFSSLFMIEEHLIKRKRLGKIFFDLPPLELTNRLNYASLAVGTSALFVGVFGGMLHLNRIQAGPGIFLEPTVLLSWVMLVVYGGLVVLRIGLLERARTVSYTSIVCYFLLLFVFVGAHQ